MTDLEGEPAQDAIVVRPTTRVARLALGGVFISISAIWLGLSSLDPSFHIEGRYHWIEAIPPIVRAPMFLAAGVAFSYGTAIFLAWQLAGWIAVVMPLGILLLGPFGVRRISWSDLTEVTVTRSKTRGWIVFRSVQQRVRDRWKGVRGVPFPPQSNCNADEILRYVARFRPELVPPANAGADRQFDLDRPAPNS
jgi:hypothetical protein